MNLGWVVSLIVTILLPLAGQAQEPAKIPRIGFLRAAPPPDPYYAKFREGLRELGYTEGKGIAIEYLWTDGAYEPLFRLAAELVRLKVDVIVTSGSTATQAARDATSTIPIVFGSVSDPVQSKFVASLSRPGGNITGLSTLAPDLGGKRLELLKEGLPQISRIAILFNPDSRASVMQMKETQVAAKTLGVTLQIVEARDSTALEAAFAGMTRARAEALIATHTTFMFAHRKQIGDLARRHGLPVVFGEREYLDAGGLMAYGVHQDDLYRRAATFVDKILKGAKTADLLVGQPTRYELTINMKTAKVLGLTVPQPVLLRADKVIQ